MFSVIMAGGEGSRLWPLSTLNKPKPLLRLFRNKTLLELTIERLLSVTPENKIFLVITQQFEDKVREVLHSFPFENIITEPVGRNTAPCIALAARKILDKDSNAVIGVFPSDHLIVNYDHFYECIKQGERLAKRFNKIVLLGLTPKEPSTDYGYVFLGEKISSGGKKIRCFHATGFMEKPDLKTAKHMINEGMVLWNSGIYIGRAKKFLDEISKNMPDVYDSIGRFYSDYENLRKAYETFPSISIDYAVTEKLKDFIAISTQINRIDFGNYNAFYELWEKDKENNAVSGEFIGIDSQRNIIFSKQKPVASVSVSNMVIIDTPDAILVCPRSKACEVKSLQEKWKKLRQNKMSMQRGKRNSDRNWGR
ncbi:hypothetical protein AC481_06425 [miscellaneous Crenarchaeota group archaeon SMTZ-80]|nr:MAG: hypothetical protein AC481_06425 [miscellaneous Crenarchaeota group archaeon SMTZ-80]KPJ58741.1 MAG: hypothetical protein AMJ42_02695 [Deltaproteobacteria bacterium DG_8]